MTHRRLPLVALAALAAALPACAAMDTAAPGRASLLSDAPPPPDRRCRVAREPAALPAADALVDSAALAAAASAAWRGAGAPDGHVLFSLRYDAAGTNVRRDVIEHRVPAALADTLQALVFAHRRRAGAAEEEWGVRLRMDMGASPVLRVGRAEVCAPAPVDRGGVFFGAEIERPWTDPSYAAVAEDAVILRVATDPGGRVTDVRVERGMRRPGMEQRLFTWVRALRFIPATEDGYPVAGEASLRLRL